MVQWQEPTRFDLLVRSLTGLARDHGPAAFSSSLSAEDMVITHAILSAGLDIEIFTIDTGRLHADTLELLDLIRRRYNYHVRVHTPDTTAVSNYVALHGRDAFYGSEAMRRECCRIRKVEPLKRALRGKAVWITGLRRDSGIARDALPLHEYDETHGVIKANPLAEWSEADVWAYVRTNDVPYNRLYDQGYRSIGCAPCTRPVVEGEDVRAGRWWWEHGGGKECGLHLDRHGHVVRAKEPV